jgi:hypothetical protein
LKAYVGGEDLVVFGDGIPLEDTQFLFAKRHYTIHSDTISVNFNIPRSGCRTLRLRRDSTLEAARSVLALELGVAPENLLLGDISQPLSAAPDPICVRVLGKLGVVFEAGSKFVTVDLDAVGVELKTYVRDGLHLEVSPDVIILTFEGCELDNLTSIRDLGLNQFQFLNVDIHRNTIPVVLRMGIIPRQCQMRFSPETTLQSIESDLRRKWSLGSIELEFQIGSFETDEWRTLPKDTFIRNINKDEGILTITQAARTVVVEPPQMQAPQADSQYTFVLPGREEPVPISLPAGSTVLSARTEVARMLEVLAENITLLFCGKALRDGFLMERLQLRGRPISTYVKDMSEVLLLTAAAMRSSTE